MNTKESLARLKQIVAKGGYIKYAFFSERDHRVIAYNTKRNSVEFKFESIRNLRRFIRKNKIIKKRGRLLGSGKIFNQG